MKQSRFWITQALFLLFPLLLTLAACGRKPLPGQPDPGATASISVKVIDALAGQPVADVRLSLKKDSQVIALQQTDSSGQAVFKQVPLQDGYKIFANAPGFAPGATPSIKLVQDTAVDLPLTRGISQGAGLLAGSAKDARTQAPLPGVSVTAVPVGGAQAFARMSRPPLGPGYRLQQMTASGLTAQTDASGQFTLNNVPAGTYRVTFSLAMYKEVVQENISVSDGQAATVETAFLLPERAPGTAGHTLIVESTRVLELDPQGNRVWHFSTPGAAAAERLPNGDTLVADERTHQVFIVNPKGKMVWRMGSSLFSQRLNAPGWVSAARDGRSFLITDTGNNRIIEVENGRISWEYKTHLSRPRAATYAPNGNILIADTGNKRVIEVTRGGQIAWSFLRDMHAPVHAVRIGDGTTLITDAGYSRIIRINQAGQPVWYYDGGSGAPAEAVAAPLEVFNGEIPVEMAGQESVSAEGLSRPRSASVSANGNVLIADTGNNRVLEVDRGRRIVYEVPSLQAPLWVERL